MENKTEINLNEASDIDQIDAKKRGRPFGPKRPVELVSILKIYVNDQSDYLIVATRIDVKRTFSRMKFKLSKITSDEMCDQLTGNTDLLIYKILDEFKAQHNAEGKKIIYERMKSAILKEREQCKGKCVSNVERYVREKEKPKKDYYQLNQSKYLERVRCPICDVMVTRGSINNHYKSIKHRMMEKV